MIDLTLIIHLAGEGKLDRLDMQIIAIRENDLHIGYRELSRILKKPCSTIQYRLNKIRKIFA